MRQKKTLEQREKERLDKIAGARKEADANAFLAVREGERKSGRRIAIQDIHESAFIPPSKYE